jgi:hypothetical protein
MKDALVGSRFQCSLEKGTLQLPPLQAVTLGILGICGVLRGPIFDRVEHIVYHNFPIGIAILGHVCVVNPRACVCGKLSFYTNHDAPAYSVQNNESQVPCDTPISSTWRFSMPGLQQVVSCSPMICRFE